MVQATACRATPSILNQEPSQVSRQSSNDGDETCVGWARGVRVQRGGVARQVTQPVSTQVGESGRTRWWSSIGSGESGPRSASPIASPSPALERA